MRPTDRLRVSSIERSSTVGAIDPSIEGPGYVLHHDVNEPGLATTLILGLAAIEDADPVETEPLYEYVDPEALEALFRARPDGSTQEGIEVRLELPRFDVTIDGTGRIEVVPREEK